MSLTNPNKPVTEARLQEFYHRIKSYLGFTEMPSEDMDEVISPLPSVQPRYHKYSTEEHIVGEWIDGSKIYEKTITGLHLTVSTSWVVLATIPNVSNIIKADTYDDSTANQQLQNMSYTRVNGNNVEVLAPSGLGHGVTMATIQYTKSE